MQSNDSTRSYLFCYLVTAFIESLHTIDYCKISLQSPEKIYIKVVELEPKITALGDNFDESLEMQRDHDETLRNLQVN